MEYARSRAVANFLRSISFSCRNYESGCPEFLPRHEMDGHERSCEYDPCFCPDSRCDFSCPVDELESHLTVRHGSRLDNILYGETLLVPVHEQSILRADDGGLFHLSGTRERRGTALSMVRIHPDGTGWRRGTGSG